MTKHADRDFWAMNHLVNPLLGLLLRSPLGRPLGRHLALVTYVGQRSGKTHQLIVQYAREAATVWIVPGQPERKTWWHNLSMGSPIELRLAGQELRGQAIALRGLPSTCGSCRVLQSHSGSTDLQIRPNPSAASSWFESISAKIRLCPDEPAGRPSR